MKRIISLLIVVSMFFTLTAYADGLDLTHKMYDKYTGNMKITATLNKPLEILRLIDETKVGEYFNLKEMCETLFDSDCTGVFSVETSDDFKKATMSMELVSKANLKFNENLNADVTAKTGYWMNYDFTEPGNPRIYMIYRTPMSTKYIVLDNNGMDNMSNGMNFSGMDFDKIMNIAYSLEDYIEKYGKIDITSSKVNIFLDDDAFKQIIIDVCNDFGKDYLNSIYEISGIDETITDDDFNKNLDQLKNTLKNINILGNGGMNLNYKLNNSGKIVSENMNMNICLDLYDLMTRLNLDTTSISDENRFIDFTINTTAEYSSAKFTKIEFPKLTNENSISYEEYLMNLGAGASSYEEPADYEYYSIHSEQYIGAGNTNVYLKLRDVLNQINKENYDISYDNGNVVIIEKNAKHFNKVELCVNKNELYKDGVMYWEDAPVKEINDSVYVDISFVTQMFNLSCFYSKHNLEDGSVDLDFSLDYK